MALLPWMWIGERVVWPQRRVGGKTRRSRIDAGQPGGQRGVAADERAVPGRAVLDSWRSWSTTSMSSPPSARPCDASAGGMSCENETMPGPRVLLGCGLEEAPPAPPYHTPLIHMHGNRARYIPSHRGDRCVAMCTDSSNTCSLDPSTRSTDLSRCRDRLRTNPLPRVSPSIPRRLRRCELTPPAGNAHTQFIFSFASLNRWECQTTTSSICIQMAMTTPVAR